MCHSNALQNRGFANNALPYIAKKNTTTMLVTSISELAIDMKLKKHFAEPLIQL